MLYFANALSSDRLSDKQLYACTANIATTAKVGSYWNWAISGTGTCIIFRQLTVCIIIGALINDCCLYFSCFCLANNYRTNRFCPMTAYWMPAHIFPSFDFGEIKYVVIASQTASCAPVTPMLNLCTIISINKLYCWERFMCTRSSLLQLGYFCKWMTSFLWLM
jgi:hypothetical protein